MLLVSRQERETDARGQSDDPLRSADSHGKRCFFCLPSVTSRKIYQNKSHAKNNSQNFFIVELKPFPPDLPISGKTGPDI